MTNLAFPDSGHALAGVAAPALAKGIFVKSSATDLSEVAFVDPALADGHDVAAVVEHEAEAIGVAEVIEGDDVLMGVDGGDRLGAGVDPDEFSVSLGGLLGDPGGVGVTVIAAAGEVAIFINDPSDLGAGSVCSAEFVHPHGGGADKVGPPTVVAVFFDAEVFPLSRSGATAKDNVLFGEKWGCKGDEEKQEK